MGVVRDYYPRRKYNLVELAKVEKVEAGEGAEGEEGAREEEGEGKSGEEGKEAVEGGDVKGVKRGTEEEVGGSGEASASTVGDGKRVKLDSEEGEASVSATVEGGDVQEGDADVKDPAADKEAGSGKSTSSDSGPDHTAPEPEASSLSTQEPGAGSLSTQEPGEPVPAAGERSSEDAAVLESAHARGAAVDNDWQALP